MKCPLVVAVVCFAACAPNVTANPCANGGGATPTPLVTGRAMKNLSVSGESLVYVDTQGRSTLRRVGLDGSNDVELYAAPPQHRLFDSMVVGDTVWLFEQESALTGVITRVRKVPLAGGAATTLTLSESAVFFLRHEASPERFFVRIANSGSENGIIFSMATDGALTRIIGPKNLDEAQVTDDGVFFMYRPSIGDDASSRALRRADKQAGATDAQVGDVHCRGSFRRLASGAFICAGYSSTGTGSPSSVTLTHLDTNGGNARTVLDLSEVDGIGFGGASVAAEAGDELLVTFTGTADTYPLLGLNPTSGATRALACGVPNPTLGNGDDRPELVVAGDTVYWIGQGARGVPPNTLFKLPLR